MYNENIKEKIIYPLKDLIAKESKTSTYNGIVTSIDNKIIDVSFKNKIPLMKGMKIKINHIDATIIKNNYKNITLKLHKKSDLKINSKVTIKDIQKDVITHKLKNTLTLIENNKLNKQNYENLELLFNQINIENSKYHFISKKLNTAQSMAAGNALSCNKFHLILGPPGTGKTHTIVEIIKKLNIQNKKILLTSHTHIAVDNVVEKLTMIDDNEIIRIGDDEKITNKTMKYCLDEHIKKHPRYSEIQRRIDLINEFENKKTGSGDIFNVQNHVVNESFISRFLRSLFGINEVDEDDGDIIDNSSKSSNVDSIYELNCEIHDIKTSISSEIVECASIVASTVISASSKLLGDIEFDYVIMDEASQIPLYLALMVLIKTDKFILIGDNHQLEPIYNMNASSHLNKSVFSTLIDLYPDNYSFLNIQYRMNSEICSIASNLYYNGMLMTGCDDSFLSCDCSNIFVDNLAVCLIDTSDIEFYEEKISSSCYNRFEADIIVSIVENLRYNNISDDHIGVISPFRCQKLYIKRILDERGFNVEVDTVYRFQGREKDVIILSFCKSNDTSLSKFQEDFISNVNQINVSLTRACMKLIIIGDVGFLSTSANMRSLFSMIGELNRFYLSDMFDL